MLDKQTLVTPELALPGRSEEMVIDQTHFVNGSPIKAPLTEHQQQILFGMGCFWGAERLFWQMEGVVSTSVGYAGGYTPNPSYEEVCSGQTGHAEVVRVVFDTRHLTLQSLLHKFWERHDPTQGMRQGNDRGTQYRSVIYVYEQSQLELALQSQAEYQTLLGDTGITTEIALAGNYYYAENYHQQYLAKNPNGYCGLGGTGICFPPQS
ncbi:peptide-methionine (S)-S-oxide reductase [Vibrio ponticus]|uniref:Peptide methionine sulfoxide reductase MsrA n=1 Tax=Vibrio ponticus TaxID=265668 RepID=A0ABX3FJY1_9VIBR|nr:peptide-methionine (S)-S-oxide reductase MsrA [Vibrio ponticus]OLQ92067.1 peptide-methionine (S)-S-oxide reductase [Vibrio ponticus]